MNEYLLKEVCYLLYRLVHVKDENELSREDYLKDLKEKESNSKIKSEVKESGKSKSKKSLAVKVIDTPTAEASGILGPKSIRRRKK